MGVPGMYCHFILRNTSLTLELLYPILELWQKAQSIPDQENKCGYKKLDRMRPNRGDGVCHT